MKNDIKEDYCSFEVSKLLKEKGFDVKCRLSWIEQLAHTVTDKRIANGEFTFDPIPPRKLNTDLHHYDKKYEIINCSAPTHAIAIKWLRENYGINIYIISIGMFSFRPYAEEMVDYGDKVGNEIIKPKDFGVLEGYKYQDYVEATEAILLNVLQNYIP